VVNFSELAAKAHLLRLSTKSGRSSAGPLFSARLFLANSNLFKTPPLASANAYPISRYDEQFQALPDDDTGTPPDTMGQCVPNHIMTALNTQVRIQDRSGAILSTVSLNNFWSPVGGSPDAFDPKLAYDPFNNRWILASMANGETSTSMILVAVSQPWTPLPTGFYTRSGWM